MSKDAVFSDGLSDFCFEIFLLNSLTAGRLQAIINMHISF